MGEQVQRNDPGGSVLLVTQDAQLLARVAPAVAACGLRLESATSVATPSWRSAALVLVDGAETLAAQRVEPRAGVLVLAGPVAGDQVWRAAVDAGASDVLRLPDDDHRLLGALQTAAEPDRRALVVGVTGGRGGAGASVLAAVLSAAATGTGHETLLCDADPLGGGADLLVGQPGAGLHWGDLQPLTGPLRPGALRDAVPRARRCGGVLTWQPGAPRQLSPAVLLAALDAARRGHDLVVVDVPRRGDPTTLAALGALDALLLLVPAEVRAVAAAAAVLEAVRPVVPDVRLLVRASAPGGLPVGAVADALELPVTARWPSPRSLATVLDRGELPGSAGRGALARAGRLLVAGLLP